VLPTCGSLLVHRWGSGSSDTMARACQREGSQRRPGREGHAGRSLQDGGLRVGRGEEEVEGEDGAMGGQSEHRERPTFNPTGRAWEVSKEPRDMQDCGPLGGVACKESGTARRGTVSRNACPVEQRRVKQAARRLQELGAQGAVHSPSLGSLNLGPQLTERTLRVTSGALAESPLGEAVTGTPTQNGTVADTRRASLVGVRRAPGSCW